MNKQTLWRCTNCEKVTPENKLLVDAQVANSPVVQYGCPHCYHMNCMEFVDSRDE
jgi:phage FluMu protein Com